MDVSAPTTQPCMMVVAVASLDHIATMPGGHMLSGTLTGPTLAVHDAITALGLLGTVPTIC